MQPSIIMLDRASIAETEAIMLVSMVRPAKVGPTGADLRRLCSETSVNANATIIKGQGRGMGVARLDRACMIYIMHVCRCCLGCDMHLVYRVRPCTA